MYKLRRAERPEHTKTDATFLSLFGLDVAYENVTMPFWTVPPVIFNYASGESYCLTNVVKNVSKMSGFYIRPIYISLQYPHKGNKKCGYIIAQTRKFLSSIMRKK